MMLRLRVAGVVAAVGLLVAACGDDGDEVVTSDEPQVQVETPATASGSAGTGTVAGDADDADGTVAGDADSSDAGDAGGTVAGDADSSDAGDVDGTVAGDAGGAETGSAELDGAGSTDDGSIDAVDAAALLASATSQLDGRTVRGEVSFDLAPDVGLSTSFESDGEGDLASVLELSPGFDPEVPAGAEVEFRYVDGVIYVRPPVPAETLAELGVDAVWYIVDPLLAGDTFGDVMGSAGGLMCVFPLSVEALPAECDLMDDISAFLEVARDAEIVGRSDVRGTEATQVRFQVSLMDLAGEALGALSGEDEGDTSEGAFFDDASTDLFAEGLEEFFAMLDTGFEVGVWIDDDNLIRRLTYDLASVFAALAQPGDTMPSELITIEFFDFDADISVEAPPPEMIVENPGLFQGLPASS